MPLFIEQIKIRNPLTVTDPKMTRYIMTLEEAMELVLFAFREGCSGDIFIQKSPSCYIGDLAQALLEIFEAKNEIKIIGSRHGEKEYEVLMTREERTKSEDLGNYFRISADNRDLNYGKYLNYGSTEITKSDEYSSKNTHILSVEEIKQKLFSIDYIKEELIMR